MAYEISFTRLTNSVRLTDRYLTVQVQKPTDPEKSSMGIIFALVEISNPWSFNSQIGQNIINILTQEYFKQENTDALSCFENALKKVNLNLSRVTQEGETNWIGNLNAVLSVITDDEIHLTQTGKAESFLFRENHINPIGTSVISKEEPDPIKTFIDITSGKLNKGDKILIASSAMLDYLSKKELQDIIVASNPYESTKTMAQFFKKENARHINSVLVEVMSKVDRENLPLEDQKEVVYLDQVNNLSVISAKGKDYSKKIIPVLEDAKKSATKAWGDLMFFFSKEVLPRIKNGWQKTKDISKKGYKHLSTKTAPQIKKTISPVSAKISDNFKKHSKTIMDKFQKKPNVSAEPQKPYSVHYYEEKSKQALLGSTMGKIKLFFSKCQRKIRDGLKWTFDKENRSVIYVLIVIVLVIVLTINITGLRIKQESKNQEQDQSQALDTVNSQFEEAKLAILYNEMDKAKTLLGQVIGKATQIMNDYPSLTEKAEEIINKANKESDKLTSTTRFSSPKLIATFPEVNRIFILGDKTVALNTSNNNIYYSKEGEKNISTAKGPDTSAGIFGAFGFDNANNSIYAETNKNQLYKIASVDTAPEKISPISGTWENTVDIGYFLGNLYFLDASAGQIWKYIGSSEEFDAGTNYVDSDKVNLKNAISFTIDGFIYILKSDGSVLKLSKGSLEDFSFHNIPAPNNTITKPKKIWTTSEINSIYVLDANRIIEFDKDGKFIHQYAFSPELKNITDFFINPKDKKIWVLDNKMVYKAEY